MAYTTFPYSSIKIFNVATAGSMDRDCEFGFYTEVWFDPPKCNGCENGCGMLYYYIFANQIFLIFFIPKKGSLRFQGPFFGDTLLKAFFSAFFSFAQLIYFQLHHLLGNLQIISCTYLPKQFIYLLKCHFLFGQRFVYIF